jgi:hypothetical protein
MSRTAPILLALIALLFTAAPAHAAKRATIGIGEQKVSMFSDPHWKRLGLRDVRYIAPWDSLKDPRQRELLDNWVAAARASGSRMLIGFERSLRSPEAAKTLPRPRQFERQFVRIRARYPDVRDWIVWNEANHPLAMTGDRPRRAAKFFDAISRNCRACRVVAADVLDVPGMASWVRRFKLHAHHRPKIWGLHNYGDANQFSTQSTREMLRVTRRGKVWFTETGGLVLRREFDGERVTNEFGYTLQHAAQATIHSIRLARLSKRIQRIYLYHWRAPHPVTNWDSAFIDPHGKPRRSYYALMKKLKRMRR